jgi:hypothetical protein
LPRKTFAVRPGVIEIELCEPIEVDDDSAPDLENRVVAAFEAALARGSVPYT